MASHGVEKRTRKRYSPTEIDAALTTLAYFGGNTARASTATGIAQQTLHDWRSQDHRDRYLEIAEREGPRLEQIAAQQARELILRAGETEHGLLDIMNAQITEAQAPRPLPEDFPDEDTYKAAYVTWTQRPSNKELGEIAGTLQRTTTSKGINGTKLLELTGRPTQIVEHRDPRAEIRAMAREFGITIEATADDTNEQRTLPVSSGAANAREAAPGAQSQTAAPD